MGVDLDHPLRDLTYRKYLSPSGLRGLLRRRRKESIEAAENHHQQLCRYGRLSDYQINSFFHPVEVRLEPW